MTLTFRSQGGAWTAVSAIVLAGALIGAPATVVRAETISDALATAYQSHPLLLARRAFLRAVDEGVPVAQSNWRPTVTFTADHGYGTYKSNAFDQSAGDQWRFYREYKLSVAQPIYRGGRTLADVRKADYNALSERAQLQVIEEKVLLDAATQYLNTLRDEAVLLLNQNNQEVLKKQLEAAEDRFRVGEITRTDVAQAEARLAGAKGDTISSMSTLEASRAAYQKTVGHWPEKLEVPDLAGNLPQSVQEATDLATLYNPNVIASQNLAVSAQHNVRLIQGELLPEVNFVTTASEAYRTSGTDTKTSSIAAVVQMTVPIYEAGNVYARIREAKHSAGQRRIEIETARREAVEAATAAWEGLQTAMGRVDSFRSQIRASEIAMDGVQKEAEVGLRTVLDVLDAEQEVLNSKVNLVRAERDLRIAGYTLLSAVGTLTAEKLGLPVQLYDPNEHYRETRNQWIGSDTDANMDNGEKIPEDYYYFEGYKQSPPK